MQRWAYDYDGVLLSTGVNATLDFCGGLCCKQAECDAFSMGVMGTNTSPPWHSCIGGQPCCNLKMRTPPPTNNTLGPGYRSGIVNRQSPGKKDSPGAFPNEYWSTWRGEKGGALMCCTVSRYNQQSCLCGFSIASNRICYLQDAYMGLVAVSPTEVVVT